MMIRYTMLFFICFSCTLSFAQKVKYFDVDSTVIKADDADSKKTMGKFFVVTGKNNDTVYYRAMKRYNTGILSLEETEQLYAYLSDISGRQLDKQTPIAIRYHQGSDPCNSSGASTTASRKAWSKELLSMLNKKEKVELLLVYSLADRVKELYPDVPAYHDKYGVLSKFFKYHYPCGSFFIVTPKGHIGYFFGEYGKMTMVEMLSELKK